MIQVVRLKYQDIHIIGDFGNSKVTKPYQLVFDGQGVQLMPFDAHFVGHQIEKIDIPDHIYKVTPSKELEDAYNKAINPQPEIITETPKEIIL